MDWGYDVARAWGFDPVITLTWCKDGLGVGRFRCNTEHILVARKGSRHGNAFGEGGRNAQALAGTWFPWPRGRHSEKPPEFYRLVEDLESRALPGRCSHGCASAWLALVGEVQSISSVSPGIAGWAPSATPRPSAVADGQVSLFDDLGVTG